MRLATMCQRAALPHSLTSLDALVSPAALLLPTPSMPTIEADDLCLHVETCSV